MGRRKGSKNKIKEQPKKESVESIVENNEVKAKVEEQPILA